MFDPYTSVALIMVALVCALSCLPTNMPPLGLSGHEKLLFQNVTSGYNTISRPVRNASKQVQMTFGISVNQILDLYSYDCVAYSYKPDSPEVRISLSLRDEKHQILSTYVWIYEKWFDENLQWLPESFNGLQYLMFPATQIWVPDIYIFNTASSSNEGFVNVSGSYVVVRYDGEVKWAIPLQIKSACPVDATYFPYDRQSCNIFFGSWIYDFTQIDIDIDMSKPDLSNYVINNEFALDETTLTKSMFDSSCCPGNGEHPMVNLHMGLRRKTIYYDYIVIAPTINLCVMTLATFLLPCECGWKIAIGLTVFLTLYVLQLLIAENVPDTNSTPLISVFLLLVMSLNCVSLIMATIIMNVKRRSQQDPIPKVPPLLLTICEKYLSKIMCIKMSDWKKIISTPKEPDQQMLSRYRFRSYREHVLDEYKEEEAAKRFRKISKFTKERSPNIERNSYYSTPVRPDEANPALTGLERTQTAESSFSTNSGNGNDTSEASCTDKLWDSKKHENSPRKHHTNINKSFSFEKDQPDEMTITPLISYGDNNNHDSDNLNEKRRSSQKRPSYKRAIYGGTYTSLRTTRRKAPKLQRRRLVKKPTFLSSVDRKYQWYFVADVIDTTTFLIYIVVMFVGILTVLVIMPLYA